MKLLILCVGRLKRGSLEQAIDDYTRRINRYVTAEVREVKALKVPAKMPVETALKGESEMIMAGLRSTDLVTVLHAEGKSYTSGTFAKYIDGIISTSRRISFVIGGPYGLHGSIVERADSVLSLSPMTLPHGIARLLLLEQIYRAFTILNGEPYSH